MKRTFTKGLAIILSLVLILTSIPTVYAEGGMDNNWPAFDTELANEPAESDQDGSGAPEDGQNDEQITGDSTAIEGEAPGEGTEPSAETGEGDEDPTAEPAEDDDTFPADEDAQLGEDEDGEGEGLAEEELLLEDELPLEDDEALLFGALGAPLDQPAGTFAYTKEFSIQSGNDDIAASATVVNFSNASLPLHGLEGVTSYTTYLRFTGVELPADAIIAQAYLSFYTYQNASPTTLSIAGDLSGGAFVSDAATLQQRSFTQAFQLATTPTLTAGQVYQTENIGDLITTMRDYSPNLAEYVFRISGDGSGNLPVYSYNANTARAPKLVIEYYTASGAFTSTITNIWDDAEEYGTGKAIAGNDDMQIGGYFATTLTAPYKEIAAFRFPDVELPENAEITDAYLEFTTLAINQESRVSNLTVRAELGNAARYQAVAGNISSRTYGELAVRYQQEAFRTARQTVRTANLKDIIDENRLMGWQSGQALAFMIDGDNYIGSVYQGGTAYSPRLVIEYTYSDNPISEVTRDAALVQNVYINEVAPAGSSAQSQAWLELYNANGQAVILDGNVHLGDTADAERYAFSNFLIPAQAYRVLALPSSFRLDQETTLLLSAGQGSGLREIDRFTVQPANFNETRGRFMDAHGSIVKYANGGSYAASNNSQAMEFEFSLSQAAGRYDQAFTLAIDTDYSINTVYYTLDGAEPSATNGQTYSSGIAIPEGQTVLKLLLVNDKQQSEVYAYRYQVGELAPEMELFTKEFAIQTGNDDAFVSATAVNLVDHALYLHGKIGTVPYDNYLRFSGVNIPDDAVVTNAYLVFTTYAASTQPTEIKVSGELGAGAAFSTTVASFQSRRFTQPTAAMTTPVLAVNQTFQTETVVDVLNEMRAHTTDLQDYVFKIEGSGTGYLLARTYNYNPSHAPRLVVEYYSQYNTYKSTVTNIWDDAEEYGTGKAIAGNDDMQIGGYFATTLTAPYKEMAAFRFPNVELPENAQIVDAYLEFTTLATNLENRVSNMVIRAELGNPAQYQAVAGNISNRTYGELAVRYQQEAFRAAAQTVRTPNLKDIIDENRLTGWQSGQALAFMIDGDNYIGSVYQGGTAYAPRLVIEYKLMQGSVIAGMVSEPAALENIYINEVATQGTAVAQQAWLELYNANDYPVVLGNGISLGNAQQPQQQAIQNLLIPAKGFRAIAVQGLDLTAGSLTLSAYYDGAYHTLDQFQLKEVSYNETWGRYTDGGSELVKYAAGTYSASNQTLTPEIFFWLSHQTGMYQNGFAVVMDTDAVNTIKYTLDGSIPSAQNGTDYTGPIAIPEGGATTLKVYVYNDRQALGPYTYTYIVGPLDLEMREFTNAYPIRTGNDDAFVSATAVNLVDYALYLHGRVGTVPYDNYLRFAAVDLPEDAVVTNAYISFTTYAASTQPTEIQISGELGAGSAFSTTAASFHNRSFTAPSTPMTTPVLAVNQTFQTENIADIMNQMRGYTADLQDYVFKIEGSGSGYLLARTYNYSPAYAPQLVVEYYSAYGEYRASVTNYLNDAEEYGTGKAISLNDDMQIGGYFSTTLTAPYKEIAAFRFPNVELPADAEITDAYLEFTTLATNQQGRVSNMVARVELGNPVQYLALVGNISSRTYGDLTVNWQQAAFQTARQTVRTPNLKNIIDETRLRGWQSGQALAIMLDGDDYIGSVYQGGTAYPPQLVIQYKFSGKGAFIENAITDPAEMQNVYINEISSEGTTGSKADWVEFYNANDRPVVLGSEIKLWRDTNKKEAHTFQDFLIPANGYRILYFDESPEDGNDHANFELKASAELLLVAVDGSTERQIHSLKYAGHVYNQTYGLKTDGGGQVILFAQETFCASNNLGQEKYDLVVSHDRGIYDTGFALTVSSKAGTTIRYTLDGTYPSATKGQIYTGPITISKSCLVKLYAYDAEGNSTVYAYTYVLLDNLKNETYRVEPYGVSGVSWRYKSTITDAEYAQALRDLAIVSVSSDTAYISPTADYTQGTFEFIDTHLGGDNYTADVGVKKFGQASISQYNTNFGVRFKRDYNSTKAKYGFFEPVAGDAYPNPGKFGRLDLKEGQDGPQADVYNLGYLRYSEKTVSTLAKQMGKVSLDTRYVHYFYNGNYMGVKTLREHFNDNFAEDYFGGDADDYTRIRFQDAYFHPGIVEAGDGDVSLMNTVLAIANRKDFQEFKKYVNVEDLIKTQILYMFIDSEREIDALIHNNIASGSGLKMTFNINDVDGAFFNNNLTGTTASAFAGGGGNYRFKWLSDDISRWGAGRMFGNFSGNSTVATAGNLEFKTLVKDQVLAQIGPAGGDYRGASGAPLSVDNVKQLLFENQQELQNAYKLDAAYMSIYADMYQRWQKANQNVLNQVEDRVKFSLEMWARYNMAHTLEAVQVVTGQNGLDLVNSNSGTQVYYTLDGSDPMGADGAISSSANLYTAGTVLPLGSKLTVRPFTTNNWGPLTISK